MKAIFFHTLRSSWRQKKVQVLSALLLLLFTAVAFNAAISYSAREAGFEKARQEVRQAWLNQGPRNPHSSAHYGHYIFQPVNMMQFMDNGIRPYTGSVLRLEAHAQNEAAFSPAEGKSEMSRMGEMNFAWLLQVLVPLFIILLAFNAVTEDRENENLKLLFTQGVSDRAFLWGKIMAYTAWVSILVLTGLLIQLLSFAIVTGKWSLPGAALFAWISFYLIYHFLIICSSVWLSARINSSSASMVIQLALWAGIFIILPRMAAGAGARFYPLEHKAAFTQALREDREKGIDGHNPEDERYKRFSDSLLKHYKVDSIEKLPINADGLIMQADEEYANQVYDKHFQRVRNTIRRQNQLSSYLSFLNPYLGIRNISMGLCESDYNSQLNLFAEAETYRRYLIHELNTKMAYGGSKTGDWDWKVDGSYWNTVKDFDYPSQPLLKRLGHYKTEILALVAWFVMLILAINKTTNRIIV